MEKLFYSISEVVELLELPDSTIRYYEKRFGLKIQIQGRNKAFTAEDIAKLREIKELRDVEKFTINGANKQLKTGKSGKQKKAEIIDKLKGIREILTRIKGD